MGVQEFGGTSRSTDFCYHKFKSIFTGLTANTTISSIENGILSETVLRSKLLQFFQNFKSLRFLDTLLSGQGFDAGLPPYLRCAVFQSIEARRRTLRHKNFACIKFLNSAHFRTLLKY